MASNITLCITSCDRHDLLKHTLTSFMETTDMLPQATIIVEDSSRPAPSWLMEFPYRSLNVQWIANESRQGQIYSIDRMYAEVKTDYIFHCEDDWLFTQDRGWMRRSKEILDKYPNVIQVSLRGNTGWHPLADPDQIDPNAQFKIAQPGWRDGWGGISFNPGLRRLSDYKKLGSYGRHVAYGSNGLAPEFQLSELMLKQGFVIADLNEVIVKHTGEGRSRAIEPLAVMPRILIAIPACHKFEYGKWESEQSPHFSLANAYNGKPYGTDIHISGKNDRIQAVRDTWLKDIEPFKHHVDVRFFYGEPHPRPALADEVYVSCPDDYASLPLKTVEICRWAVQQDYDWLLKADDDTYIYVDRLVQELMSYRFEYAGCDHHGVCTGGPGYWLSRRAMRAVLANPKPSHWAEDVTVGKIMNTANIRPFMLPGHNSGFGDHWIDIHNVPPGAVTLHAVRPEDMRELYRIEHP